MELIQLLLGKCRAFVANKFFVVVGYGSVLIQEHDDDDRVIKLNGDEG